MYRRGYSPDSKLLAFENQIPSSKIGIRLGLFLLELVENRFGPRRGYANRSLKATIADKQQAHLLKIRPGDPLMHMEGTTYLEDNTPIDRKSVV